MSCCSGYCCNAAQLPSPESKLPLVQINPDIDTALFIYYRKDSLNEGSTFFKLSIIIPTEAAQVRTNFNLITNKMIWYQHMISRELKPWKQGPMSHRYSHD